MQPDFKMAARAAFLPEMLWGDFEKWLMASVWDGRKNRGEPCATLTPNGQSPTLSERQKWLASVSLHSSFPNYSPASSFSSTFSSFSSTPNTSLSSSSSFSSFSSTYFSNEYFAVRPSPKGGLGAFAIRDIPKETIIIAEEALFKAHFIDEVQWIYEAFSSAKRQTFDALHHWIGIDQNRVFGIFKTNRFELGGGQSGVFTNCSRFNHACHPHTTCTYQWHKVEQLMKVSTLRDIVEGEELTISYMGWSVDRALLKENYGFECDCPGCLGEIAAAEEAKNLAALDSAVLPLRSRHRFA